MLADFYSLCTTPIRLVKADGRVANGSGFFYSCTTGDGGSLLCLVTNYHALAGSSPKRNRPQPGGKIQFEIHLSAQDPHKVRTVNYPLQFSSGKSSWFGSPLFPAADIAFVPLPSSLFEGVQGFRFLDDGSVDSGLDSYPGQPVSIVGYPLGFADPRQHLPIWKTGHLASEPELDFGGEPNLLVHVAGRTGMSGAPALVGHRDIYQPRLGAPRAAASGKLLGIYSSVIADGRGAVPIEPLVSLEEAEDVPDLAPPPGDRYLELGVIWKGSLVKATLASFQHSFLKGEVLDKVSTQDALW